ncbi:UNVERIFIED_CONTAM: Transposon Tf2-12 polyprotein [Sesamum radiatum]|uniref:Transposon Tf2-12 polyprotein n=1 Tax=Sesamum radiatum TaxID=300843 RepID=A0AAW2JNT9_SESRA
MVLQHGVGTKSSWKVENVYGLYRLNKACPKDPYPLLWIDLLVDSTTGCALFSATYQRLVNKIFKDLIGKTKEVYIDDILVKSKEEEEHLNHLQPAFEVMRKYSMKLNPTKCTFGVRGEKFLGYMVSDKGIKANLEKNNAIMQMSLQKTIKDVQKLTGKVASLAHFISRSADRNLLFFKPIGKVKDFQWMEECEQALRDLKQYLATPPLLANPKVGEPEQQRKGSWMLHVDGSSTSSAGGAGILLQGPGGVEIEIAAKLDFPTTNKAEYEALTMGLEIALEAGVKQLDVHTDSQLVAIQIEGLYETRE